MVRLFVSAVVQAHDRAGKGQYPFGRHPELERKLYKQAEEQLQRWMNDEQLGWKTRAKVLNTRILEVKRC